MKRGFTLSEVADLVGCATMSVSRHERGLDRPGYEITKKYVAIYHGDVTRDDIDAFFEKAQKARASVAPPDKETVT